MGVLKDMTISVTLEEEIKIVSFSAGTDAEISAMLDAHYAGKINIEEYWAVGDTRQVQLNAMSSGTGASESHVKQLMTMIIIGFNHDDLKTPIGSVNKSAITVQCREVLGNNGTAESGYYWGSSSAPSSSSNYSTNPRRTWCNTTFLNSMPTTFSQLVKTVIKKNLSNHSTNPSSINTEDKVFLLSVSEVYGTSSTTNTYKGNQTLEGSQYQYYTTSSNKIKYKNNDGSKGTDFYWWVRSPSTYNANGKTFWFCIEGTSSYQNGLLNRNSDTDTCGLAPAFCL